MREEGERGGREGEEEGEEEGGGKGDKKIASFLRPSLPHVCSEGLGTRLVQSAMHGACLADTCLQACCTL